MGVQAVLDATERGHLVGDVPALAAMGVALLVLAPATRRSDASRSAGRDGLAEARVDAA